MEPIFLSRVTINEIRHLQNIDIFISDGERKHLILTGKNGSGKSTILNEIKNYILVKTLNWMPHGQNSMEALQQYRNTMLNASTNIKHHSPMNYGGTIYENVYEPNNVFVEGYQKQIHSSEQMVNFLENYIYAWPKRAEICFFNQDKIYNEYNTGGFITSYYDAKRSTYVGTPSGIIPMNFQTNYSVGTNIGKSFLQHIVNLKAEQSFANDEQDYNTRNRILSWFSNFEDQLRYIFDDNSLSLTFDRKNFNFFININNRSKFDFNSMSEGFSSVLSIVTDLLLRSDQKDPLNFSGIVLIDEIETHLHIDLQKKILPFLTNLFPSVQFVVTTHSPFILNSISQTVIYDVEKRSRFEDFSTYSSEGIIEGYFRQDKYSEVIKEKVNRFEELFTKTELSDEENKEIKFLKDYFEAIPKFYNKELALKIEQIKLLSFA